MRKWSCNCLFDAILYEGNSRTAPYAVQMETCCSDPTSRKDWCSAAVSKHSPAFSHRVYLSYLELTYPKSHHFHCRLYQVAENGRGLKAQSSWLKVEIQCANFSLSQFKWGFIRPALHFIFFAIQSFIPQPISCIGIQPQWIFYVQNAKEPNWTLLLEVARGSFWGWIIHL